MISVKLYKLGHLGEIDLGRFLAVVNKKSNGFVIKEGDEIVSVGPPDLSLNDYSFQKLYDLMPADTQGAVQIGITTSPIERITLARQTNMTFMLDTISSGRLLSANIPKTSLPKPREF